MSEINKDGKAEPCEWCRKEITYETHNKYAIAVCGCNIKRGAKRNDRIQGSGQGTLDYN